jgi:hypothetical protein
MFADLCMNSLIVPLVYMEIQYLSIYVVSWVGKSDLQIDLYQKASLHQGWEVTVADALDYATFINVGLGIANGMGGNPTESIIPQSSWIS